MNNDSLLIIGGAVAILVVVVIVAFARTSPKLEEEWKLKVRDHLRQLSTHLDSRDSLTLKNVLIEMDKLLDFVMRSKNISGTTMGERLKSSKDKFDWNFYQKIWEAHKKRNELVHEVGANSNPKEMQQHISVLKKAIEEIL